MKTNQTIEAILNHRSIRKWKDEELSDDIIETLSEVAMRTSTSNGMQNASIIRVKDPAIKIQLTELSTQKYMNSAPELWVFIADNFRNDSIVREKSDQEEIYANDGDKLFQGITDACLMAQNVAVAAESLGLGIVYFGSIINDAEKTIEILGLPENTFPVVGMGIGYPDQNPDLKPRIGADKRIFVDQYKKFNSYTEELAEYDQVMDKYYDLRNTKKSVGKFTDQVVEKNIVQRKLRAKVFDDMKKQGFNI